jgi:hypothetical protein
MNIIFTLVSSILLYIALRSHDIPKGRAIILSLYLCLIIFIQQKYFCEIVEPILYSFGNSS